MKQSERWDEELRSPALPYLQVDSVRVTPKPRNSAANKSERRKRSRNFKKLPRNTAILTEPKHATSSLQIYSMSIATAGCASLRNLPEATFLKWRRSPNSHWLRKKRRMENMTRPHSFMLSWPPRTAQQSRRIPPIWAWRVFTKSRERRKKLLTCFLIS